MKISVQPFIKSQKYSVELEDFEPLGGVEWFLKNLCQFLDENFLDWYQGVETGIGHMTYQNNRLTVIWTDFPLSLSFDCQDKETSVKLQFCLEDYFRSKPLSSSSR